MDSSLYTLIKLPNINLQDESSIFFGEDFPFEVKRIFYLYGFNRDGILRGDHAHHKCKQILFCLDGEYVLKLDNGFREEYFIHTSSQPNIGIMIDVLTWIRLEKISEGTKILVLASHKYDESDYIRNYDKFKDIITK